MSQVVTIQGAWSADANAWVSEPLLLTGSCYLEITLPGKGRVVIKKSETANGPWPKAIITKWGGPSFKIRVLGSATARYIKIYTTSIPNIIEYANI